MRRKYSDSKGAYKPIVGGPCHPGLYKVTVRTKEDQGLGGQYVWSHRGHWSMLPSDTRWTHGKLAPWFKPQFHCRDILITGHIVKIWVQIVLGAVKTATTLLLFTNWEWFSFNLYNFTFYVRHRFLSKIFKRNYKDGLVLAQCSCSVTLTYQRSHPYTPRPWHAN